jgi:hypothetical protein
MPSGIYQRTEEEKKRLKKQILKNHHTKKENYVNPHQGKKSPNLDKLNELRKGKTIEEIYGIEKAEKEDDAFGKNADA